MNGGLVAALVGMSLMAGAGAAYVFMHEFRKTEARVTVIERPAPAPPATPPVFGPVPNVTVNAIPTPAPVAAAPAPVRKKAKKKSAPAKKLQSQWGLPVAKPFSLGDLFNAN